MEYVVASGALGFDGLGWWWEKPLTLLGLIKPELFTVVLRTLTYKPRPYPVSNLSWLRPWTWLPFSPWSCVRLLPDGGAVNKVGLYNPGIREWCWNIGPYLNYGKYPIMASIFGSTEELVFMTEMLNRFHLVGIEVNYSCPNTQDHPLSPAEQVIDAVKAVKKVSEHPVIVKISVDQDYLAISRGLVGIAEAISINSVPWKTAFPDGRRSLLWELEKKVGGGGGGVSGRPAQVLNWKAVRELAEQGSLPVIAPSIMEFGDMERVRKCGAKAVSFGTIHLRTPLRPTQIVRKEMGI